MATVTQLHEGRGQGSGHGNDGHEPGMIEILNRSGQVQQRLRFAGGEMRVGRAYDNDIIIADPYVCAHHLVIRTLEGGLEVEDLDSINGSWLKKGKKRIHKVPLNDGELLQLGHSQLRFRALDATIDPALRDTARFGLLGLLDRRWMLPLALFACIAALSLGRLVDETRMLRPGLLASMLVYPMLGIMLWAGFWSLINRLIAQRANFHVHLAIAALGVAALFVNAEGVPLLGFALGWTLAAAWATLAGQVLITAIGLYAHLQYATHGQRWAQALGSGALAALLIAAPSLGDFMQRDEFSSLPRLQPLLKPPSVRLARGESMDHFFKRADKLRLELQTQSGDSSE